MIRTTEPRYEPIPPYGELFTIEEFKRLVRNGEFSSCDGCAEYATETHATNVFANPDEIHDDIIDERFTHIIWYNK
jgi:hypothetical protein